ncbi:MAG: OmpA family protein [Prevotella sp.]|nr:OmpA family protein [Prevotella sp.]
MKYMNFLFAATMALLAAVPVSAQEDTRDALKSYSYVEVQGGMEWTATDAKIDKLLSPIGALSIGHFFTPVVGARLHVSGLEAKGRFEEMNKDYKWNFITTDADLLINLSSLFSCNYARPLNLIFVGGIGLTNAWKNDDLKAIADANPNLAPLAWGKNNRLSHNLRAGLRLETNVTKPLGLSLEVAANSLDDRFNSKTNDADDWMISGMIGLSYRFGKRYEKPAPIMTPVVQEVVEDNSADLAPAVPVVAEEKPEPKAVVKKETLHEEIFYIICKSDPTEGGIDQLKRVAQFMSNYKNAIVKVVGYADKGTGNPEINVMYAERRAAECKDALVNKYNCDAERIQIDSKGDTVQPFAENDKNRCVIIDSEAQYTVYE